MYKKLRKNKRMSVGASLVLAQFQRDYHKTLNNTSKSGITLIALILTIIILLILAMVSISYIMRENIIKHAETAVNQYQIEAEKEAISLAYGEYVMNEYAKIEGNDLQIKEADSVVGNKTTGWTVTFPSGNVYTVDSYGNITGPVSGTGSGSEPEPEPIPPSEEENLLERYIQGSKGIGRNLTEIFDMDNEKFKKDNTMGEDISGLVGFLGLTVGEEDGVLKEGDLSGFLLIKYLDKAYEVKIKIDIINYDYYTTEEKPKFIFEKKGLEGQTVEYSYDGKDENKKQWTIIKDNEDGTVEIISPDVLKKPSDSNGLKLGQDRLYL